MTVQTNQFERSETRRSRSAKALAGISIEGRRLLENFELLVEAPGGLRNLRCMIVELALSGRLLSLGDGLTKVRADQVAVPSVLPPTELPELPPHWNWSSVGALTVDGPKNGYSPKSVDFETPVRSLTLTATTSGRFDARHFKFIGEAIPPDSEFWLREGDVLIQRGNTIEYVGVAAVYRGPSQAFIYPDLMMRLRVSPTVDVSFMHVALNGLVARSFMRSRASGTSGTMPKINQATLKAVPIPLPPLAEQRRLVAKVDQLMALCDELEARQTKKRETSTRLTKSALDALTTAEGAEEFGAAWKRVVDNFDVLVDRADKVDEVRRNMVDLAIHGRLVQREPLDGDAPSFATSDKEPFPLPLGWRWSVLENLASHIVDCLHTTPKYVGTGHPAIRTADLIPGRVLVEQARRIDDAEFAERTRRLQPMEGDIFYSREGERLGIAACVPPNVQLCVSQRTMHIRVRAPLVAEYVMWAMNSRFVYSQAVADTGGSTSPHVNMKAIRRFLVPVPPVPEQHRIVRKIEHLLAVCDDLEARLRQAEGLAAKLVAAALQELVA